MTPCKRCGEDFEGEVPPYCDACLEDVINEIIVEAPTPADR